MKEECKHRDTWIICGGYAEWCYRCGAYRGMKPIEGQNTITSRTTWVRPVGKNGKNPYQKMRELKKKS